jgi:hypothetical protein
VPAALVPACPVGVRVPAGTVAAAPAPGIVVAGALVAGVLAAPRGAAGAATVLVATGVLVAEAPELPASDTSAALSAPRESTITALSAITGARQLGIAARRVRAAAPHRRHHSCSASSGAPHSGHPSTPGGRGVVGPEGVGWAGASSGGAGPKPPPCGGAATLTWPRPAGG